ncbi:ATP phosphoribosyltransferase regulatory subunit [Jeotgalibacillus proteolyticus]|uniref:ATP phosphoribosyltransferase regulatory subunit n=1 Tax=Jeotgalibacillus proteolyticus TaxID=2082395 RepID=A0A2S5GB23_9BACL|nr:ATP phosphoribosyltransferase regulatory subunit [Jeotgalibacillus proteolyticus]PPA70199.1 ATP phosphoribosyltransferase regulatory subunit [Jeotgalibacillus proteolyticus]
MSELFMFEKPMGMRDTFPHLYRMKKEIRSLVEQEMTGWGYEFLETPTLEYNETVGEASAILEQQVFKLLDQQGRSLVLRPDMTAPIARVAASKLLKDRNPLRLAYSANVFRAQQREGGRPAEFEQMGVELIGDGTVSADAETIALLISSLLKAGLKDFTISIGHMEFVQELFLQIVGTEERAEQLRRYLYDKNYVGFRKHVESLPLSSIDKQRLLGLLSIRGNGESILDARSLIEGARGEKPLTELQELMGILNDYGYEEYINMDVSLVSHMSYYTGVVFEVYADRVGYSIGNGGRYNHLLHKFGAEVAATGFAFRLDYLIEALSPEAAKTETELILFSSERRSEAISLANELRTEGKSVISQDVTGISDVDRYTAQFHEVHWIVGRAGKSGGRE